MENEISICVLSGKSGGEFAGKDKNLRYCAEVGAEGVKKTKYRGVGRV